jgi:hypothetical protein
MRDGRVNFEFSEQGRFRYALFHFDDVFAILSTTESLDRPNSRGGASKYWGREGDGSKHGD